MSEHTPGPWQVEEAYSQVGKQRVANEYFVRRDGDSIAIAADVLDPKTGVPSEANARLIAAAPDLLESCMALMLKARHSPVCASVCGTDGDNAERCDCGVDEAYGMARAAIRAAREGR